MGIVSYVFSLLASYLIVPDFALYAGLSGLVLSFCVLLIFHSRLFFVIPSAMFSSGLPVPFTSSGRSSHPDLTQWNELFENVGPNRARQILEFETRAGELLRKSNFVLYTIIGVLIFAALFIVFAGYITESGTKRDVIADMQQEKQTLLEKIERIIQKESEFQSENRDILSSLKESVGQAPKPDIMSELVKIEHGFADADKYMKEYNLVVDTFNKELDRISPRLDEV